VGAENASEIYSGVSVGVTDPSDKPVGIVDVDEVHRYKDEKA